LIADEIGGVAIGAGIESVVASTRPGPPSGGVDTTGACGVGGVARGVSAGWGDGTGAVVMLVVGDGAPS
jgi:hypothetical protein